MDELVTTTLKPVTAPDLEPIRVCTPCLELNLVTAIHIRNCMQCGNMYCIHATSPVDPNYCVHCLHDVSVTTTLFRAPIGDSGATKLTKSIKFGGVHYLFQQRRIATLDELELELAIEYHLSIYHSMVFERERKRNERIHRNAGVALPVAPSTAVAPSTKKQKREKKPVSTRVATANTELAAALKALTPEQLNLLTSFFAKGAKPANT